MICKDVLSLMRTNCSFHANFAKVQLVHGFGGKMSLVVILIHFRCWSFYFELDVKRFAAKLQNTRPLIYILSLIYDTFYVPLPYFHFIGFNVLAIY